MTQYASVNLARPDLPARPELGETKTVFDYFCGVGLASSS